MDISVKEMVFELKYAILSVVNDKEYINEWFDTKPYASKLHGDEEPDIKAMAKVLSKKTLNDKFQETEWENLILTAIAELNNEGHRKLVTGLE